MVLLNKCLFFVSRLVVSQNGRALHIVFPHQFLDSPEWFGVSTDEFFQVSALKLIHTVIIRYSPRAEDKSVDYSCEGERKGERDSCGIVGLTRVIWEGSGVEWLGIWKDLYLIISVNLFRGFTKTKPLRNNLRQVSCAHFCVFFFKPEHLQGSATIFFETQFQRIWLLLICRKIVENI